MASGRTLFHLDLLHPNPKAAHLDKCAGSAQKPFPFRVIHSPRSEPRTQASSPPAAPRAWHTEHLACAGAMLKDGSTLLGTTELARGKTSSSAPRERQLSSALHHSRVSGPPWEMGLEGTCASPVIIKFEKHYPGDPLISIISFPHLDLLIFPTLSLDSFFWWQREITFQKKMENFKLTPNPSLHKIVISIVCPCVPF